MNIISKTALFQGIPRNELEVMLTCLKPKTFLFSRNELIVISGAPFENVGIVLKGTATVSKENAAGSRTIMTLLEPGDIFGEMVAFSSQSMWPATVQAQEPCEIFFLPRGKIIGECDRMCPWHRSLIQNFLKIISEKALNLNKQIEYLALKTLRAKISNYLLEHYQKTNHQNLVLPMKRNELADFLNVSRPSLSRELCRLRDEGVIDFHMKAFRILDVEALKRMSVQ